MLWLLSRLHICCLEYHVDAIMLERFIEMQITSMEHIKKTDKECKWNLCGKGLSIFDARYLIPLMLVKLASFYTSVCCDGNKGGDY